MACCCSLLRVEAWTAWTVAGSLSAGLEACLLGMQIASGARGREGGVQANCVGQLEVPVLGHAVVVIRRVSWLYGDNYAAGALSVHARGGPSTTHVGRACNRNSQPVLLIGPEHDWKWPDAVCASWVGLELCDWALCAAASPGQVGGSAKVS